MITLGVEEEYFLLDPDTGLPAPRVEQVRAAAGPAAQPAPAPGTQGPPARADGARAGTGGRTVAGDGPAAGAGPVAGGGPPAAVDGPLVAVHEVQEELLQAQIEVATPVCTTLDEVAGHLLRLRYALTAAAERTGCRLAACGTAPLAGGEPVPVARAARAGATKAHAAQLADEQLINGMHVHVSVPDRATGVAVLNRVRPWLPVLVAMAGNSPVWHGKDTGFASWRTIVFDRWPVSGPPPVFAGAADYDRRISTLVDTGAVLDRGQVYWQARLSDRYPTVELRLLDVQSRPEEATLFAGLARALVATALRERAASVAYSSMPQELLELSGWHAARYGLTGTLIDPAGRQRPARDVVADLMDHLAPALDDAGDTRHVLPLVHRLLAEGGPAQRQRRALARDGMPGLLSYITGQTASVEH